MQTTRHTALRMAYASLMWLRDRYWSVRRPTLVGVRALIVRGDQVLLIRHRSGRQPWALPGGGVERYERLHEAAGREAWEETGAKVVVHELLGIYDRFGEGVTNFVAVYVCTPLGEPNPPLSLEIAEARFFAIQALPRGLKTGDRRRIDEYVNGERGLSRIW